MRAFNSGYECWEPRTHSPRVVRDGGGEGLRRDYGEASMFVNRGIVFTTIRKENGVSPVCVRIPLKPATDSETKPATHSDLIPAGIPL